MKAIAIVRQGIIFGAITGVFALAVQLAAIFLPGESTPMTALTGSMLELLIIGSAGRRAGQRTRRAGVGTGVGAFAGGVSEVIHSIGGSLALALSPAGRAAFATLSPEAQAQASDPVVLGLFMVFRVGLLIGFGALFGWLGAWSAVRFETPRDR